MSTRSKRDQKEPREIPPALIVTAIVMLVLVLGTGGWYAFNGGWLSDGQKDEKFKHEMMPIMAAKHGDTELLDAENKLRKKNGQAPLAMPDDKKSKSPNDPAALAELQRKMGAK
jgi:hypothetical protein